MEVCITNELRNKVAAAIPDINAAVIELSVTLEFKQEEAFKYTEQYVRSQTNKICAFDYFNNLVEVFSEIRYSAISAECCRELLKSAQATEDDKKELSWQYKYYAESAIYRYYSFWEYVGRFFNEYYDLKLDVNKKDLNKEREFYSAQVLNIIIKKYYQNCYPIYSNYGQNLKLCLIIG